MVKIHIDGGAKVPWEAIWGVRQVCAEHFWGALFGCPFWEPALIRFCVESHMFCNDFNRLCTRFMERAIVDAWVCAGIGAAYIYAKS